jgi:hypothetical protein
MQSVSDAFGEGMGIALSKRMPRSNNSAETTTSVTSIQSHKYKHKLKRSKSLWSLSLNDLLEELKRSLDDVSLPQVDPELDQWIDTIVVVVGTKFGPGTNSKNSP